MVYCTAVGCNNNQLSNTSFHKYPKDLELRRIWLEKAGRTGSSWKPSANSVLCGEHFERDCFYADIGVSDTQSRLNKRQLKPDAVPTIFNFSQMMDMDSYTEVLEGTQQSNSSDAFLTGDDAAVSDNSEVHRN